MPAGGLDAGADSSMADLLGQLDRTAAKKAPVLRPDTAPGLLKLEHVLDSEWRPPPSKGAVKQHVNACAVRNFNQFLKTTVGDEFGKYPNWRPQVPEYWESVRTVMPQRSVRPPPHTAPPRYRSQPEFFPEGKDEQCHPIHRQWLRKHQKERENHVYPVVAALQRVDRAKDIERVHAMRREIARDLMTRPALVQPKFSAETKAKIDRTKMKLRTARALKGDAAISAMKEEEKEDKARIEKAKSSPALYLKVPTPRSRARHIHRWTGPDRTIKALLKESTPWRDEGEMRELKSLGRLPRPEAH
mmetsp:Transcript_110559/g.195810  ORF Transcript_110559/g.195810 Transcript_110559/m.195810 type:complete len:302 (-) Transcript_110559:117-1022(-)